MKDDGLIVLGSKWATAASLYDWTNMAKYVVGESDHTAEYVGICYHSRKRQKICWGCYGFKREKSGLTTPWNLSCCNYTVGGGSPTGRRKKNPTEEASGWNKRAGAWRWSKIKKGLQNFATHFCFPHENGTYPAWWHPLHHPHRTQSESAGVKHRGKFTQREISLCKVGEQHEFYRKDVRTLWLHYDTFQGANRSDQAYNSPAKHSLLTNPIVFQDSLYVSVLIGLKRQERLSLQAADGDWDPLLPSLSWGTCSKSARLVLMVGRSVRTLPLCACVCDICVYVYTSTHDSCAGYFITLVTLIKRFPHFLKLYPIFFLYKTKGWLSESKYLVNTKSCYSNVQ